MAANLTPYDFFLPSDEDSNSSEPNRNAEKKLPNQKSDCTVEEATSAQDPEESYIAPDVPEEATMHNHSNSDHSNVSESDKMKQLDVADLKFISPIKSDGSGGLESDVCLAKTKASQPDSSTVHRSDNAKIPIVVDSPELLPHESQDHEEKIQADDNDENTKFETAEHGALLNNSADETMSEFPSSRTKTGETAGKDESVVEQSKSSGIEEPVTIRIKSEEFENAPQQNGPSDNQNESVNSEENMKMEFTLEPSIDVPMTEPCEQIMPEDISAANLVSSISAKTCQQAMQEFIRHHIDEDQDCSSENSESERPCNGFIDGMADEGEEDTPSEDSNAIPDRGESIGFSDSEPPDSTDDFRSSDSFICDDEVDDLLSGSEYDLGYERKKSKKSRIIDADLLGDGDIIKRPRKKVADDPKKRKRILEMYDSSNDDETTLHIRPGAASQSKETSKVNIDENPPVVAEGTNHCVQEKITEDAKETHQNGHLGDVVIANISIISTNSDIQKTCKNSFISSHQNTGVEDKSTEIINTLVETFCSAVKNGKVYLNICNGCDDPANLVLRNSWINDKVKQVIDTANKNDSPNSATINNGDVSDAKNSPNRKKSKNDVAGVKKKKRKQKSKIIASKSSEDQTTAEKCRLVKIVNDRDTENTQKRATLKRKLRECISDLSEDNQLTEHRKKLKTSRITLQKQMTDVISLTDQLLTDVKNRPRRAIKPSTSSASESWIETEVLNVTTSSVSKKRVPKK